MVNRRQVLKSAAAAATVLAMPKYASASSGFSGFYPAGSWMPAKQPMIQVYPRPDSETNTWARHRWAYYDGAHAVQYKIPLGVSFGAFPYVYELLSGPPGMTIGATYWNPTWGPGSNPAFTDAANAGYGYLLWTPTASVSGATVQILVTDQQSNTLTITFTVSTSSSTSQFIFIDAVNGNDSAGTGTISAPWRTFTKATTGNANTLLYMRSGTYTFTATGVAQQRNYSNLNTNTQPSAYMGFPGDTPPVISMTTGCLASNNSGTDIFMQGLNPNGYDTTTNQVSFYWNWQFGVNGSRQTFDSITWTNSGRGATGDNNAVAFYFDGNDDPNYTNYTFLNNYSEPSRSQSGQSGNNYLVCSFYGAQYALVQGCSFVNPGYRADGAFYLKVNNVNCCVRGNTLNVGSGFYTHACDMGQPLSGTMTNNETCYNTIVGTGHGIALGLSNIGGYGTLWCYRNSVIGDEGIYTVATGGGPLVFQNNAAQGGSLPSGSFVTTSGNIIAASGLLDSNGKITSAYATYLGTVGAQITLAGSILTPKAPVPLTVS